jgi:hypothetical protein
VHLRGDRVEAADSVHRCAQGITESRCGSHSDPEAGERSRAYPDDDRVEISRPVTRLGNALEDVRREDLGVGARVDGHAHRERVHRVSARGSCREPDDSGGHGGCGRIDGENKHGI